MYTQFESAKLQRVSIRSMFHGEFGWVPPKDLVHPEHRLLNPAGDAYVVTGVVKPRPEFPPPNDDYLYIECAIADATPNRRLYLVEGIRYHLCLEDCHKNG